MKTHEDARRLATWLVGIAERNGVRTEALLTPMAVPLGRAVGNANEVVESIEALKGRGPAGSRGALRAVGGAHADPGGSRDRRSCRRERRIRAAIADGSGVEKFRAIIEAQGGNPRVIDDYALMPQPAVREAWLAPADGVVASMDAELIGRAAVALGAGRDRVDAAVDAAAGIDIVAPVGAPVRRGDPVVTLVAATPAGSRRRGRSCQTQSRIGDQAPATGPLVIERIDARAAAASR